MPNNRSTPSALAHPSPRTRTRLPSRSRSGPGPLTLLSLGHACVDVYQGAVAALVPYFLAERAYSYAAASGIVLAASLLSSVVQPLFGALTDRWRLPWLLPVSTLVGGAGVALAGVTGSYPLTLTVIAVSGIGVAAYHPESARVARAAGRGTHTSMGWFSLGGNLGFAAAPLLVAAVVGTAGLRASPLLGLPAVAGAGLCVAATRAIRARRGAEEDVRGAETDLRGGSGGGCVGRDDGEEGGNLRGASGGGGNGRDGNGDDGAGRDDGGSGGQGRSGEQGESGEQGGSGGRDGPGDDWWSFGRLSGAIVCRSIVFVGLSTFVPVFVRERTGWGEQAGTAALFVLYLGGAVGTVAGGRLAGRFGRVAVVRWSYAATVPAVAGVVLVPGPALYPFIALTSAGLYVPFSLHVTLGQDYLPGRMGTASGVTLGLTVSVGGVAGPLIGALADATSLRFALAPLIVFPAVGRLFLRGLREPVAPGADGAVSPTGPRATR